MGFTVVDGHMRGTGCSGGAFDFFEPLQNLDGYRRGRDGGPSALGRPQQGRDDGHLLRGHQPAVHRTDPAPSLAAIAPLSVIDQTQTTLYPGGILKHRVRRQLGLGAARRGHAGRPDSGQPWAYQRIQEGDATCAATRALHPEAADLMAKIRANDHYVPRSRTRLPDQVRRQDQRPGLHGLPVDRRADGGHCRRWPST